MIISSMKHVGCLFLCLALAGNLVAQITADQLPDLRERRQEDPKDPHWVLRMAWVFEREMQRDSLPVYAELLERLAPSQQDTFFWWATYLRGAALRRSQPDRAKSHFEQAYPPLLEQGSLFGALKALESRANMEYDLGQFDESIAHYEEILQLIDPKLKAQPGHPYWTRLKSIILNNFSIIYNRLDKLVKANELLLESKKLAEELGNESRVLAATVNLGIIQIKLNNLPAAKAAFTEGISLARELGAKGEEGFCWNNLGTTLAHEENYDSAKVCFEQALRIATDMNNDLSVLNARINLGATAAKLHQWETALDHSQEVLDMAQHLDIPPKVLAAYLNLADIYFEMGHLSQAQIAAKEADRLGEAMGDMEKVYKARFVLSKIAEERGNHAMAMQYFKEAWTIKDTLFNSEKVQQIQELQARYEQEKKEREIAALSQQAEIQALQLKQRNVIIVALVLILALLGIQGYFFYRQKILTEKHKALEAKQQLLRSQMNPHFFFNSLSSIQSFLWEKEPGNQLGAARYLSRLSKLMRNVLESSSEEYVPLEQEIETLENYLSLQQYRYNHAFHYQIECDEALEKEEIGLPPMLAQPFIENAIEHGFNALTGTGKIKVAFARQNGHVRLTIEDNGIGRAAANLLKSHQPAQHQSLATQITEERLTLLKKAFQQEIKMDIVDLTDPEGKPQGTRVQFDLPLVVYDHVA